MAVSPRRHALLEHRRRRTCDVGDDVPVPPNSLLEQDAQEQNHGGVLADLVERLGHVSNLGGILSTSRRDVVEILFNMVGVDMVTTVRRFPGEVRGEKSRVQDEAHSVVQVARGREGAVSAVVRNHPEPCPDDALGEAVDTDHGIVCEV